MAFDNDNIGNIEMHFRHIAETDTLRSVQYEPNDTVWLKQVFGFEVGDSTIQEVGSVHGRPGRIIVFPATLQHRFVGYRLKDPTKRGSSKAIAIHLVDPNIRTISTANVPPQRPDWTMERDAMHAMNRPLDLLSRYGATGRDLPLSFAQAKDFGKKIIEELIEFSKYQTVAFGSNPVYI